MKGMMERPTTLEGGERERERGGGRGRKKHGEAARGGWEGERSDGWSQVRKAPEKGFWGGKRRWTGRRASSRVREEETHS